MKLIKNDKLECQIADVAEVAGYLWQRGWAERNGGNISVNVTDLLTDEEKALPAISERYPLPKVMNALKGNFFLVTGTNRRMRYVASHPMENMAVIRISDTGDWYEIIADNPVRPTSELPSHLSMHDYLKGRGIDNKVVLHTHPTDLVAMTHNRVFLQPDVLGKLLWSMIPETRVIVPKGLGIVPYKLPGSLELADATIRLLDRYDVVMWEKHGALAVGSDVIECFDMIDTLSKSAQIYWTNAYPVAYSNLPIFTNWNNGVYSGARTPITVATTKIALNKTINYGVARLDVKAAFKSADGTVPAGKNTKVTLTNHNFVVKGILIGGLPDKLDWEMHPSASDTYSKIVYDNRMNTNGYELTNAATPDFAGMTPFIYSLLPETADCSTGNAEDLGHTPNIALEVLNDGPQFYGLDGNLVPEGGTFYLVGKLTYKKDNSKSEVVRVFQQDYNTTANLSINSLAKAYNTVPDLINPRLELALAVDIDWKAGLVIDVPIGD